MPVLPGEEPAPEWVSGDDEIVAAAKAHLAIPPTASTTYAPPPQMAAFKPGEVVLKAHPPEPELTPEQIAEAELDHELFMPDLPKGEVTA